MSYELMERLDISYESEASASYLILSMNLSSEDVFNYQIEMIRNNTINGILTLDMRQKDDTVCFYYDITSKLSLSQFLKHSRLKRNQFIGIISAITKVLLDCRGYLLYEKCVILDTDYIYISPGTLQISVAYLPVQSNTDLNSRFKDFIAGLIIHSADIDDNGSDNFLQRIISNLKADAFSIEGFYKLLAELTSVIMPPADNIVHDEGSCFPKEEPEPHYVKSKKNRTSEKGPGSDGYLLPPAHPLKENSRKAGAVKKDEKSDGEQGRGAFIIIAVLLQIIFICLIISGRNFISSMNNDTASVYIGIGVAEVGINALIFKKLHGFKPVKAADKDESKPFIRISRSANIPKEEKWSMTGHLNEVYNSLHRIGEPKKASLPKSIEEAEQKAGVQLKTGVQQKIEDQQKIEMQENVEIQHECELQLSETGKSCPAEKRGETVILEPSGEKYPYLQWVKNGTPEKIFITKKDFLIGRLREQVDYTVDNNAVGKVHALILCSECGNYFIKDLNSRNGTFINNQRIKSNEECEIKSGDKITLANSNFVFIAS